MDRLVVMKSFVTVAELGSFSGAAKALGTSGSMVSRHIADLEGHVGVRLVNRTARSISLTDPGQRYREFAQRILSEIDEEDRLLGQSNDRAEGMLSVICPKWIGTLDLGDAMAEFAVAHPKITVRFELGGVSDRSYDFLDEGFDVGFRTRTLRDSGVRLRRITDLPFALVASPDYLKRTVAPSSPADIVDRDCLVHVNQPVWRIGAGKDSTLIKIKNVAFLSNSHIALQKSAVHGRGIAMLPVRTVVDDILAGRLVRLLPDHPIPDRSLFAISSPDSRAPRKVKVFLDYLMAWFAANPPPVLPSP